MSLSPTALQSSKMDCAVCQRLEAEVQQFTREHTEALATLNENRLAFIIDYRR
jgi:hypothetical protein